MLEKLKFDLVLSEPQNIAILTPGEEENILWREILHYGENGCSFSTL